MPKDARQDQLRRVKLLDDMNTEDSLERCYNFINCQLGVNARTRNGLKANSHFRTVTISRQAGCGAFEIAEQLAEYLESRLPKGPRWAVFDRNLVQKVLEDHRLPGNLAKFMPENWISEIHDTLDDFLGLHPPSWILVKQTAETILGLAKLGNVILVGRAANIITARLPNVFHVRLVASLESRLQQIQETHQLKRSSALEFMHREDKGRQRYLKKYYGQDINDPLLYHLVINTDLMNYPWAAKLIGDCVLHNLPHESTSIPHAHQPAPKGEQISG